MTSTKWETAVTIHEIGLFASPGFAVIASIDWVIPNRSTKKRTLRIAFLWFCLHKIVERGCKRRKKKEAERVLRRARTASSTSWRFPFCTATLRVRYSLRTLSASSQRRKTSMASLHLPSSAFQYARFNSKSVVLGPETARSHGGPRPPSTNSQISSHNYPRITDILWFLRVLFFLFSSFFFQKELVPSPFFFIP